MKKHYNIELHIEELVLHGFSPGDRDAIGAAISGELTRLFSERGAHPALQRGHEVEKVDGGAFTLRPGAKATSTGTQIAQSVYRGLRK